MLLPKQRGYGIECFSVHKHSFLMQYVAIHKEKC